MERRGVQEIRDLGIPIRYNPPPQIIQESTVKLPLAPILSTPPDRIRGNAMASTRRGSAIFCPTTQTLDPPPPPPPLHKDTTPDPDPPTPTTSNSKDPPPQQAEGGASSNIRYRECLKNHAASRGGRVVDGCGEFMPAGEDGKAEALRCAACDCHRNFHRKEFAGQPHKPHYKNSHGIIPSSAPPHHKRSGGPTQPAIVNFSSGGAAAESSSEDLNMFQHPRGGGGATTLRPSSNKRFRTKFSQDQKDRMHEFATKIGWRIQKQDEQEVERFCSEAGVKRQVFKVWMHNNKQAMKKQRHVS